MRPLSSGQVNHQKNARLTFEERKLRIKRIAVMRLMPATKHPKCSVNLYQEGD